jgi:hypothetical protein
VDRKISRKNLIALVAIAIFAVAALLVGTSVTSSQAQLADGGFCVQAVYEDGGQTATAGAPGCTGSQSPAEPSEPVSTEVYNRMSITVTEARELIGKAVTVRVLNESDGSVLDEEHGTVSVNGYLNLNIGVVTEDRSDLKIEYTVGDKSFTVTIPASQGDYYNEGTARELGIFYVTRSGIKSSDNTLVW